MPAADEKHVFPGGYGAVTESVQPVTDAVFSINRPGKGNAEHLYLPASRALLLPRQHDRCEICASSHEGICHHDLHVWAESTPPDFRENTRCAVMGSAGKQ